MGILAMNICLTFSDGKISWSCARAVQTLPSKWVRGVKKYYQHHLYNKLLCESIARP